MAVSERIHLPSSPRTLPLKMLGDERLAKLAAGGNAQALGVLYERHAPALLRYCQSITLHAEDAHDAFHNAMLKAMRALESAPPTGQVRAWLFKIAHNESVTVLRRRRTHTDLDAVEGLAFADENPDPAATRERLRQLVSDLQALPERQRGALLMRELCGLEYEEIACALGVTQAAVRQSVSEARGALHAFEAGRDLACNDVRRSISDGDRRSLRSRNLRAHLRGCSGCTDFETVVRTRRRDLRLLVPAAPGWLASLFGGGLFSGGGAAAGGGLFTPVVAKTAVTAMVVAVAGVGAAELPTTTPLTRTEPATAASTAHVVPAAPAARAAEAPKAPEAPRARKTRKTRQAAAVRTATRPARTATPAANTVVAHTPAAATTTTAAPTATAAAAQTAGPARTTDTVRAVTNTVRSVTKPVQRHMGAVQQQVRQVGERVDATLQRTTVAAETAFRTILAPPAG